MPAMPGGSPQVNAATARGIQDIRNFANRDRAGMTLKAFEQLAAYLACVPGRKSLVWISNTFPAGVSAE